MISAKSRCEIGYIIQVTYVLDDCFIEGRSLINTTSATQYYGACVSPVY